MPWDPVHGARFWVPGEPKAMPRPRARVVAGRAHIYNPSTADAWKADIALAAERHRPPEPLDGPVAMRLVLHFRRPQRLDKRGVAPGVAWHIAKPDIDNCVKAVADSLGRIDAGRLSKLARRALLDVGFWRDDCQLCWQDARKVYAARGTAPGAAVQVWGL